MTLRANTALPLVGTRDMFCYSTPVNYIHGNCYVRNQIAV